MTILLFGMVFLFLVISIVSFLARLPSFFRRRFIFYVSRKSENRSNSFETTSSCHRKFKKLLKKKKVKMR